MHHVDRYAACTIDFSRILNRVSLTDFDPQRCLYWELQPKSVWNLPQRIIVAAVKSSLLTISFASIPQNLIKTAVTHGIERARSECVYSESASSELTLHFLHFCLINLKC
jgi:hypothetical protein